MTIQNSLPSAGTHCTQIYTDHAPWLTGQKKTTLPKTQRQSSGRSLDMHWNGCLEHNEELIQKCFAINVVLRTQSTIEENRVPMPALFAVNPTKTVTICLPVRHLKSLTKVMEDLKTDPIIQLMICGASQHVQKNSVPTIQYVPFTNFGGNLTTISIFNDQSEIGWINFLCGRWGVTWKQAQQRHYLKIKSKKSPVTTL